jgi:hypothetical protein
MKRTFKTVDYDQALDLTVRLGDCLPLEHLARFVVDSVALLDLSALYAHYGGAAENPHRRQVKPDSSAPTKRREALGLVERAGIEQAGETLSIMSRTARRKGRWFIRP